MFDILEELAAIHRNVARDDAAQIVSVTLSRTYDSTAEDVWDALTNPKRLPRWFYPVSGDLRVGGTFQFEGNAGGDVRRCERPTWLQVTFGGPESVVDVRLVENDGQTTLELVHTVPLAIAGSGAGSLFVGPGWDGTLLGLAVELRGESKGNVRETAQSPQVIEFNRGSIDRWLEAIELSGTANNEEIVGARDVAVAQFIPLNE